MQPHEQLRLARERKGFSVEVLAGRTGVRDRLLDALERGAYAELPSGLYGRQVVRTYAKAVGLDPEEVLRDVLSLLPATEDPIDGLARLHGCARRRRSTETAEEPLAVVPSITMEAPAPPPHLLEAHARATDLDDEHWRLLASSAIDGGVLAAIGLALLALTAAVLRVDLATALGEAAPGLVPVFVLIALVYFLLLGGIRNETIGSRLAGGTMPGEGSAVYGREIAARALRCAFQESSILVAWLVRGTLPAFQLSYRRR